MCSCRFNASIRGTPQSSGLSDELQQHDQDRERGRLGDHREEVPRPNEGRVRRVSQRERVRHS